MRQHREVVTGQGHDHKHYQSCARTKKPGHTRTGSTRIINPSLQHWMPGTKHIMPSGRENHHLRQIRKNSKTYIQECRRELRTQENARPLLAEEGWGGSALCRYPQHKTVLQRHKKQSMARLDHGAPPCCLLTDRTWSKTRKDSEIVGLYAARHNARGLPQLKKPLSSRSRNNLSWRDLISLHLLISAMNSNRTLGIDSMPAEIFKAGGPNALEALFFV